MEGEHVTALEVRLAEFGGCASVADLATALEDERVVVLVVRPEAFLCLAYIAADSLETVLGVEIQTFAGVQALVVL